MNKVFIQSVATTLYKLFVARKLKKEMPLTNSIGKRKVMNADEASLHIRVGILSGKPYMVGRYGGCENNIVASYYLNKKLGISIPDEKFDMLCNNAGFFPRDKNLIPDFVHLMQQAGKEVDMLGIWNWILEDYIIEKDAPNAQLTRLRFIEPWVSSTPWSSALKGKKVLVVHPFSETIKSQYENKRELLFNNPDMLPEFDLLVYKSVQSIAGNIPKEFNTWFDALNKMQDDIRKMDFDIAIIGCGAYGFPLAAFVKRELNKQAIHLGGATQLLFGVTGNRWEQGDYKDDFKDIINEHWVRPSQKEKVQNSSSIEGSCYW